MSEQSLLSVLGQPGRNSKIGSRERVVNHMRKSNNVLYGGGFGSGGSCQALTWLKKVSQHKFMWLSPNRNSERQGSESFPSLQNSSHVVTHQYWKSATVVIPKGENSVEALWLVLPWVALPWVPLPLADFNLYPFLVVNWLWAWQLSVSSMVQQVRGGLGSPLNLQLGSEMSGPMDSSPSPLLYYLSSTYAWGPRSSLLSYLKMS